MSQPCRLTLGLIRPSQAYVLPVHSEVTRNEQPWDLVLFDAMDARHGHQPAINILRIRCQAAEAYTLLSPSASVSVI